MESTETRKGTFRKRGNLVNAVFTRWDTESSLSCPTGIWFYDVKTGKENVPILLDGAGSLTLSPDRRFIAKGGDQFQLWEIATQRQVSLPDDLPDTNVVTVLGR